MAYVTPIISHCVRTLLRQVHTPPSQSRNTSVHGLVLVPTRELAIQVSKEFKVAAKVANKYLSKCTLSTDVGKDVDAADSISMEVEPLAVYGGVPIETQIASLLGEGGSSTVTGRKYTSLVVAATAGRLLDILKKLSDSNEELSVASAFANLQAIVFDEADRIAGNVDMAGQVDEIISILNAEKRRAPPKEDGSSMPTSEGGGVVDVVSCLVSATLPEKAKEMCDKWVPRSRVVIKIDSMKVGEKQYTTPLLDTSKGSEENNDGGDGEAAGPAKEMEKKTHKLPQNLDLASIPSNIVQTLHVCANHKKPKKLITTLSRIYLKADARSGRFSANNRLCIVFFATIKTLKYVSGLLLKEGLRCAELYGSLVQTERDRRLLEFKCGKKQTIDIVP